MAKTTYSIPAVIGYTKDLTFRIAPVSKAIMSADADWLYDEELCLDNEAAQSLLMPFLEEFLKKPFETHDEINIMGFSRVRQLVQALRETASMLENHFDDPAMKTFKAYLPVDILLPPEDRDRAALAGKAGREELLRENIGVAVEFYDFIADHLSSIMKTYGQKGFRHIAITSPI